jgi:hypothetical protein
MTSDLDLHADIAAGGLMWLQWSTAEVPEKWMEKPYPCCSGGSGCSTRSGSALGRNTSPLKPRPQVTFRTYNQMITVIAWSLKLLQKIKSGLYLVSIGWLFSRSGDKPVNGP